MESGIAWDALEFPEEPMTRALSMKEPQLLQQDFHGFFHGVVADLLSIDRLLRLWLWAGTGLSGFW